MERAAGARHLPVPGLEMSRGSANYMGFSSLNLQEVCVVPNGVRATVPRGFRLRLRGNVPSPSTAVGVAEAVVIQAA
ncbi:MAG: hypothetical protein AB1505_02005 [Candidatus Latescibacterota bacterium]